MSTSSHPLVMVYPFLFCAHYVFRHEHSTSIKDFVCLLVRWSVGPSVRRSVGPLDRRSVGPLVRCSVDPSVCELVGPHNTLTLTLTLTCGQIDLKFGRDLHVDLLSQFLFFFFLSSSSNSSSSSSSSFSEIKVFLN
jgi:hypothetical protein